MQYTSDRLVAARVAVLRAQLTVLPERMLSPLGVWVPRAAMAAIIERDIRRELLGGGTHDSGRTLSPESMRRYIRAYPDFATAGANRFLEKPVVHGQPARLANVVAEQRIDRGVARLARRAARAAKSERNRRRR